jgi:hypothetical protein
MNNTENARSRTTRHPVRMLISCGRVFSLDYRTEWRAFDLFGWNLLSINDLDRALFI